MNKMEEEKEGKGRKEKTERKEVDEDYDSGRHNKKKMKEEASVAYTESPIKYRIGSHFIKILALVSD